MPFMTIEVSGAKLSPVQLETLGREATQLMAEIMRKDPTLTAVRVEEVPGSWTIDGTRAAVAAHLDVKVSAGTNTAAEKARFIAKAMQLLRNVIGNDLAPVTYVVVHEVPGDSWGWNGETQAARAARKAA